MNQFIVVQNLGRWRTTRITNGNLRNHCELLASGTEGRQHFGSRWFKPCSPRHVNLSSEKKQSMGLRGYFVSAPIVMTKCHQLQKAFHLLFYSSIDIRAISRQRSDWQCVPERTMVSVWRNPLWLEFKAAPHSGLSEKVAVLADAKSDGKIYAMQNS
jgi:hypothetical protein